MNNGDGLTNIRLEVLVEMETKIARLESELNMVDEALARRPALDKLETRYDKIMFVCSENSRLSKLESK